MNNKVTMTVVLVLIVIAVALGIGIYINGRSSQPVAYSTPQNTNPTPPTPVKSAVQILVDANPGPNATTEQLKTYSGKVFQASVESTTLDVSGCSPIPSVLRTKTDSALTIKNTDSVSHKILNGTALNLDVAANSSKSVSPKLPLGIYSYSCDSKITGIIIVIP